MFLRRLITLAVALAAAAPALADRLPTPAILRSIGRSVYEVVVPKPTDDPLTYEKPLPFDLLPYKVRNDKYYSVGSAFAINDSTLVTAAHVLSLLYQTRLAPPCVRDAGGRVHAITTIVAFSSRRDVVAFTIERTAPLVPLPLKTVYAVNQPVFAVGNALGEGTVIRDGLLTSTSPEVEDGLFEELRFSAAASPGNSGGPLLDSRGQVIGMVVRKSENENLNYALPVAELLGTLGKPADVHVKLIYALPFSNFQKLGRLDLAVPLPLTQAQARERFSRALTAYSYALRDSILIENKARVFPEGAESQELLHTVHSSLFPGLVAQGKDNTWDVFGPKEKKTYDLENNGKLVIASNMFDYEFFRIDLPDSITVPQAIADDRLLMDELLKGIYATRDIGNSQTRITSFGAASEKREVRDRYGRRWLVRGWYLPHSDEEVLLYALPVPSGLAGYLRSENIGQMESGIRPDMELMADFFFVNYYGTLRRWQQYFERPELHPDLFRSISFAYQPGKRVSLKTPRFAIDLSPSLFAITDQSDLQLKLGFIPDSGRASWDITSAVVGENKSNDNVATLTRYAKPGEAESEETRNRWMKIAYQQHPYDQTTTISDDRTLVMCLHPRYGAYGPAQRLGRPVLYTASVSIEGKQDDGDMKSKLKKFNNGITIIEQ